LFTGKLTGKGSVEGEQNELDELFGEEMVHIAGSGYADDGTPLEDSNVASMIKTALNHGRIPVLLAPEERIQNLLENCQKPGLEEFKSLLESTRTMAIPDLDGLGNKGWLHTPTVLRSAALQGYLTAEHIAEAEKEGQMTFAQDIKKLMRSVTGKRNISISDLYLMLSFNDIPKEIRDDLEITDAIFLISMVLDKLMLGVPMDKIDSSSTWKARMRTLHKSL